MGHTSHWERQSGDLPRPDRLGVSLASPLVVELSGWAGGGVVVATTFGLVKFLLQHPMLVGSFAGDVVAAWHRSWSATERAERNRVLASFDAARFTHPEGDEDVLAAAVRRVNRASAVMFAARAEQVSATGVGSDWVPPY